ncbi:MAG: SUMF1/EgtB/PvdO family nonheme iron enzyme [Saprospiraceae bacterium]
MGLRRPGYLSCHSPAVHAVGRDRLKDVGWFGYNSHGETKDVGQKQPNELGLYDMSGNVWEWGWDRLGRGYYRESQNHSTAKNPRGPGQGFYCVLRGGNWGLNPEGCRIVCRIGLKPEFRYYVVGFRLVLSPQSVG